MTAADPPQPTSPAKVLAESWVHNAANWAGAVRGRRIARRRAGTDDAIVGAIVERRPARVLDVGCGEGWLVRRVVAAAGCVAMGIDGSAPLIAAAEAADPEGRYGVLPYDELIREPAAVGTDFDVIVCNYALFGADAAVLLGALGHLLTPDGAVVIQTPHPCFQTPATVYQDGWRTETFAAFEGGDWQPMPWFFRTLESWLAVIGSAGLRVLDLAEPRAAADGPPLSLLLTCGRGDPPTR